MASTRRTLAALQVRSAGALATGVLAPNESIDAVWQHLCDGLSALVEKGGDEQQALPENGLTQRLINELEQRRGYRPYYFQKEEMEDDSNGQSPRSDIAVRDRDDGRFMMNGVPCAGARRFLVLEAKRLPTPGTGREREYLAGPKGGMERFKRGAHAADLETVGIIGYIQRHAFEHWRDIINGWVDELIAGSNPELPWDEQDKLQLEERRPLLALLRSNNLRISDRKRLTIHHLWVQLAHKTVPSRKTGGRRLRKKSK